MQSPDLALMPAPQPAQRDSGSGGEPIIQEQHADVQQQPNAEAVPTPGGDDFWNPDLADYHSSPATTRQNPNAGENTEDGEREAKRQVLLEDFPSAALRGTQAANASLADVSFYSDDGDCEIPEMHVRARYAEDEAYFTACDCSYEQFSFDVARNVFA